MISPLKRALAIGSMVAVFCGLGGLAEGQTILPGGGGAGSPSAPYSASTVTATLFQQPFSTGAPLYVGFGIQSTVVPTYSCPTGAIAAATLGSGGTGYIIGDRPAVVQAGGGTGEVLVTGVSGTVVTTFSVFNTGGGYSVANGVATSGGHGTGLTINITDASGAPQFCNGLDDTVIGSHAVLGLTQGKLNTILGVDTGTTLIQGSYNTLLGVDAGQLGTAFSYVTAVGQTAAANNTASEIVAVGFGAYQNGTNGIANTSVGTYANRNATDASWNTAVGLSALGNGVMTNGNGDYNTAIGFSPLYNNTGARNVAIGARASYTKSTGDRNTCVGESACYLTQTGSGNAAVGQGAFYNPNGASSYNSALGYSAGPASTATFNNTIAIGAFAAPTASNQGVIGSNNASGYITDLYIGQGVTQASPGGITIHASGGSGTNNAGGPMTLVGGLSTGSGASGDACIQTGGTGAGATALNTPVTGLCVKGGTQLITAPAITTDATHTDASVCEDTTTHALYSGSGTLGICLGTSSARYKHDIAPLTYGLDAIMALKPISYKLNADHGDPNKTLLGFTAEDMQPVIPQLVGLDTAGKPNSADYVGLIPVLVRAVQEQQAEIDALKDQIANDNVTLTAYRRHAD